MELLSELSAFDGKHTEVLEALAARLSPRPALVRDLCALAKQDEAKLQSAATWLLKRFHEQGYAYSEGEIAMLLDLLGSVGPWEAKLHLLQMLPGLAVPEDRKAGLWRLCKGENFLQSPNKFLRAWSYNALAVLATQHPAYRKDAAALLAAGREGEAASVRARIRNIVKELDWA